MALQNRFWVSVFLMAGCSAATTDRTTCPPSEVCSNSAVSEVHQKALHGGQMTNDERAFAELLASSPALAPYLDNAEAFGLQVIYTRIDRQPSGAPRLETAGFRQGAQFYYPASLIKLPVAALALERMQELGLDKDDRFEIQAFNDCSRYQSNGCDSIGRCIERIFVLSDNDAFNRLYEFLGPDAINARLQAMGYQGEVRSRFKSGCLGSAGKRTAALTFFDQNGNMLHQEPSKLSRTDDRPPPRRDMRAGRRTRTSAGIIDGPMDFSQKSYFPLSDLHLMMIAIVLPDAVPSARRFAFDDQNRRFLLSAMAMRPRDIGVRQPDSFRKYLLIGGDHRMPKNLRIYNKVGLSYGFVSDVAYITDPSEGVEFFLSATIYVNENGMMNDGHYEYDSRGYPFMKALGQWIYDHERERSPRAR